MSSVPTYFLNRYWLPSTATSCQTYTALAVHSKQAGRGWPCLAEGCPDVCSSPTMKEDSMGGRSGAKGREITSGDMTDKQFYSFFGISLCKEWKLYLLPYHPGWPGTWSVEQAGCELGAILLPLSPVYWLNRACFSGVYDVLTCLGCDRLEETGANSGDSKQGLQARLPVQTEEFRARAPSTRQCLTLTPNPGPHNKQLRGYPYIPECPEVTRTPSPDWLHSAKPSSLPLLSGPPGHYGKLLLLGTVNDHICLQRSCCLRHNSVTSLLSC